MTPPLLTCPYCNAQVERPAALDVGSRIQCPRCDASFLYRPSSAAAVADDESAAAVVAANSPAIVHPLPQSVLLLAGLCLAILLLSTALKWALPESNTTQRAFPFMLLLALGGLVTSLWLWFLRRRRSNGVLAAFVLANMAAMALMILPFALATTAFRRGNDPRPPAPAGDHSSIVVAPVHAVGPAALAGLGYLPENCNVVAAIHVAALVEQPIAQHLFVPPKADADAPPRPWLVENGVGLVTRRTGLKTEEIDHVIFGIKDDFRSTTSLVVRTRKPYSTDLLASTMRLVEPYRQKKLYRFSVSLGALGPFALPVQGQLWCADAQTMILQFNFKLEERDKELLIDNPRTGTQIPPRPLRAFLADRLSPGTLIWWAAADVEPPDILAGLVPGTVKDSDLAKLLPRARGLTMGLRLQKDAAVLGNIECPDQATAKRLSELLKELRMPGLETPKVAGPAPDELHPWVAFQMRGNAAKVLEALRPLRLIRLPGKQ
jgi:hypothetical protein